MNFLQKEKTVLVIIDVQEKLFPFIENKERLQGNLKRIILGAQKLNIPILVTEQYTKGLGKTIPELQEVLVQYNPIEKISFSCCREENFNKELAALKRNQVLICGIESHICVYQTCRDLDNNGYYVHLMTDCIGSRNNENKKLAIDKLQHENNIFLTGYEMALFEIMKTADIEEFKEISKILR
jgi:nicotinamidase-related amidase